MCKLGKCFMRYGRTVPNTAGAVTLELGAGFVRRRNTARGGRVIMARSTYMTTKIWTIPATGAAFAYVLAIVFL
jgi:adenine/guanine phosphoribosyltransferase-like PRPP-binding protein